MGGNGRRGPLEVIAYDAQRQAERDREEHDGLVRKRRINKELGH
jgi:hypothetical protein